MILCFQSSEPFLIQAEVLPASFFGFFEEFFSAARLVIFFAYSGFCPGMILFLKQERPGAVGFCRSGFSGIVLGYPLEDIVGHSDVNSSVALTLDGIYEEGFHKKSHANVVLHGFCDPIGTRKHYLRYIIALTKTRKRLIL